MRTYLLLMSCLVLLVGSVSAEDLEQLLGRGVSSSGTWAHADGFVLMRGNQPVCAYGVSRLGKEKPQYTYFVLFTNLPKSDDEFSVTGPLRSNNRQTNYTVIIAVGEKKFEIAHHLAIGEDGKVTTDDLTVGGEKVEPKSPRVFVVDLAAKKQVTSLDLKPPAAVPDPSSEENILDLMKKAVADYVTGSAELQKALK